MAFQADGTGVIEIEAFSSTGNFNIAFPPFEYELPGNILMANSNGPAAISIISSGRVKVAFGSSEEYVLTIPDLVVGDTISDLVINRTGGSGTISAEGVSQSFTSSTTMLLDRIFGASGGSYNYRGKFYSGSLSLTTGYGQGTSNYDFSAESGTTLIDTTGNQTDGVLNGFTTGGFIANSGSTPAATTSTLKIATTDNLPASGTLPVRILKTDGSAILYAGTPTFVSGATDIDLPIADVPVGTDVDWVMFDVAGEQIAGARQATVATEA